MGRTLRAGNTVVGRLYTHPLMGIGTRVEAPGTRTPAGEFVSMRWNGVPGYIPVDVRVQEPEPGVTISVAWRGKPALEIERLADGRWEIRRWNFKGDLVNTGSYYPAAGVKMVLDYYANQTELPKWAYPLQKVLRKAASL